MRSIGSIAWLTLAAFASLVATSGSAAADDEVPPTSR
jgi:hypothetical protein